jgi:hypothetical protein
LRLPKFLLHVAPILMVVAPPPINQIHLTALQPIVSVPYNAIPTFRHS